MSTQEAKQETMTKMLTRVDQARFPKDLTTVDRQLIAATCIEYGLDPVFGELMIYQGRPYVTIDARRRKAQETEKLDGTASRPATQAERAARKVEDTDRLWRAEIWKKGCSHPFIGWGKVTQKEIDRAIAQAKAHGKQEDALPIVKDPEAQTEKRAEAQGLRKGFHLPLPSFEEVIEGEFTEVTNDDKGKPKSPTKPAGTITPAQRNKIWGDASKMGYKDKEIHTIIRSKWGVESVNDLSVPQASALIDMIQKGEGLDQQEQEPPPEA